MAVAALLLARRSRTKGIPNPIEGPSPMSVREWLPSADPPLPSRRRCPRNPESPRLRPSHGEEPPLHVDVSLRATSNRGHAQDLSCLDPVGFLSKRDETMPPDQDVPANHAALQVVRVLPILMVAIVAFIMISWKKEPLEQLRGQNKVILGLMVVAFVFTAYAVIQELNDPEDFRDELPSIILLVIMLVNRFV